MRNIRILRDKYGFTQADLAKKMLLTRASVNAWEMGLSVPSTQCLIELSLLFHVTTDYLLGLDNNMKITTENLTEREISVILNLVEAFNEAHKK